MMKVVSRAGSWHLCLLTYESWQLRALVMIYVPLLVSRTAYIGTVFPVLVDDILGSPQRNLANSEA